MSSSANSQQVSTLFAILKIWTHGFYDFHLERFLYTHNLDTNGIVYWIATQEGNQQWSNPGLLSNLTFLLRKASNSSTNSFCLFLFFVSINS